jgi:hypothetical protein
MAVHAKKEWFPMDFSCGIAKHWLLPPMSMGSTLGLPRGLTHAPPAG